MASLSLTVQKFIVKVKVDNRQINKQTGQQHYAPDHSFQGIKCCFPKTDSSSSKTALLPKHVVNITQYSFSMHCLSNIAQFFLLHCQKQWLNSFFLQCHSQNIMAKLLILNLARLHVFFFYIAIIIWQHFSFLHCHNDMVPFLLLTLPEKHGYISHF